MYNGMDRDAQLRWAKERALKYVAAGDKQGAMASFLSDVLKSDDGKPLYERELLGMLMLEAAMFRDLGKMQEWLDGFN